MPPSPLSAACFLGPLVLQRQYQRKYVEPHELREKKDEEQGSRTSDQEEEKNYVESVYA